MKLTPKTKLGVVCRGGPHNGPFAAGFFRTFMPALKDAGMRISGIYADSGSVPSAVLAAIGRPQRACDTWAGLTPGGIITQYSSAWRNRLSAGMNLMTGWSVFDSEPLYRLIRKLMPADEVFSPEATPVAFSAVDYLTGKQLVFRNTDERHRPRYHFGMMASMGLVPFLEARAIVDVTRDGIMEGEPYSRDGELADVALGMDAGYVDNLLLEIACRDGMDAILVVDLNGLSAAPLGTERPERWSDFLQRAFNILVTTNDQRRLHGVERTNEAIKATEDLRRIAYEAPPKVRRRLERLAARMDRVLVGGKRRVQVLLVENRACAIPFDFSRFSHREAEHLLTCGHRAALATAQTLRLTEAP